MSKLSPEEQQVFYLIKSDLDQARYFWGRVNSLKWFNILRDEGYFNPDQVQFDENNNAYFWNVLDYLERVSEQVAQNPEYGKELLDIIGNTVDSSLKVKKINNYHIWWYCVKILNNIPSSIIKENLAADDQIGDEVVKYGFRTWLIVWTDPSAGSDLAVSDIGEKLLPRFLSDHSTVEYAEAIIDVISRIRTGEKQHASAKKEDVSLMWDSYWILQSFKKNHAGIGEKCSIGTILQIADRLKKCLEYQQRDHYANIDVGGDIYQIEVSRVPEEGITDDEIEFKDNQYECIVKQFSPQQPKDVDRQSNSWALHNIQPAIEIKQFSFSAMNKESFMLAIEENSPANINWTTSEKFEKKIRYIFDGLYSDYSQVWFKSLASGGDEHASGAEEVLAIVLRDVLLAKCEANRDQGRKVLDMLLGDRYRFPIFRRLVLLCIDKYWSDYGALLERFFEVVPNALEEADYEVELQDILYDHNQYFNSDFRAKLKALIANIPEYYVEEGEKLAAYWQYKWFSPVRNNPDFSDLYEKAKQKAEPKDGKAYEPERSAFKGGFAVHKSPISKEGILQKPVAELVKYLSDFKWADFWHGSFEGEPDKEGLADALQASVKENPKKFTDEIDAFLSVDYFYLHRVCQGLKESWNDNKQLDWEKIFDFSLKYFRRNKDSILKEAFQAQGEDSGKGKYIWIVDAIVDLIADGCKDDKRTFDPKYFDKVKQIFGLVLPLLNGERHPDTHRDALTYALNTTLGRVVMSYISFSLRIARATQKREPNWGRNRFERFFTIGVETDVWFGCYLPQMKYLDEQYTRSKIESYSQKSADDFVWQMFMEGYLFGARVYPELHSLMRSNYVKALENGTFDERIDQRLVQHIAFGYLYYGEMLTRNNADGKDSLFWKMLTEASGSGKTNRWLGVVSFFWSLTHRRIRKEDQDNQEEIPEDAKKKILEFWEWTYDQQDYIQENLGDDYNSFLGRMAGLTVILDKIDEFAEKWLMLCAPHIDRGHNATFFVRYLTEFQDDESIKRIGKIFLRVLQSTTPTFRQEDIQLIVRRLYSLAKKDPDVKKDADDICHTYGRRGMHFLKDLFYEHQEHKS